MNLCPLLLETIYVPRAWGGLELLRSFHPDMPAGKIGESWDIASYPTADCRMLSGPMKGLPLSALLAEQGRQVLGRPWKSFNDFPLLLKFLAPLRDLPLQAHPADEYARRVEGQNGKTECWLILDCRPGAELWLGLKNVRDKAHLAEIFAAGTLQAHTQRVPVRTGDVFFVPAGIVHGLGANILVYEVQQNSDVTYRLDDFGLNLDTPEARKVHLDRALEVIDLEANLAPAGAAASWGNGDGTADFSPYFGFELKTLGAGVEWNVPKTGLCRGLTILDGNGRIRSGEFQSPLAKGQSWLIPAALPEVFLQGPVKGLVTFFPE